MATLDRDKPFGTIFGIDEEDGARFVQNGKRFKHDGTEAIPLVEEEEVIIPQIDYEEMAKAMGLDIETPIIATRKMGRPPKKVKEHTDLI